MKAFLLYRVSPTRVRMTRTPLCPLCLCGSTVLLLRRRGGAVDEDAEVVAGAAGDDEEMPGGVEVGDAVVEMEEQQAERVAHAAGEEPQAQWHRERVDEWDRDYDRR